MQQALCILATVLGIGFFLVGAGTFLLGYPDGLSASALGLVAVLLAQLLDGVSDFRTEFHAAYMAYLDIERAKR